MERSWKGGNENMGPPGYLGKHRDKKYAEWNKEYGRDMWKLMWIVYCFYVDFLGVCALYEDAYFQFLLDNPDILKQLVNEASDVYDDRKSNIHSRLDYTVQETDRTHIQDIALRRCLVRIGIEFKGNELIRIRQEKEDHELSIILSPGKVPFHRPEWIVEGLSWTKEPWWNPKSVEDYYQSNRILLVAAPL